MEKQHYADDRSATYRKYQEFTGEGCIAVSRPCSNRQEGSRLDYTTAWLIDAITKCRYKFSHNDPTSNGRDSQTTRNLKVAGLVPIAESLR